MTRFWLIANWGFQHGGREGKPDCAGDVRLEGRSAKDCGARCEKAAGYVCEYYVEPSTVHLSVEEKSRNSPRGFDDTENHHEASGGTRKGSVASAQLRCAGICCAADHRGVERVSRLAERGGEVKD